MNLILGNLSGLKAAVLPETLVDSATWDSAIAAIGKGVALSMQRYCNRLFERIVADTFEHSAAATYLSLPRFPVEIVSEVALKSDEASGFVAQPSGTVITLTKTSGLIEFGTALGYWRDRVRITYTGGLWADYTEDNSGSQPAGSTAVPGDLLHAWHLQVQRVIEGTKLLTGGSAAIAQTDGKTEPPDVRLTRRVKEMLEPFIRYS